MLSIWSGKGMTPQIHSLFFPYFPISCVQGVVDGAYFSLKGLHSQFDTFAVLFRVGDTIMINNTR